MNRKTLIEKLLDRWYIKVICLIVAIFLYIFHQASLIEKKTFTIPLHIVENGIVQHVGNIQNSVALVIRTNPENMKSIYNSDIKATINLDTITEKVCVKEEFIQGVKISTFNNITYNVYSNGEKDVINNIQSVEFDNSSYNGNTGTLINEANNNIYKYSDKIDIVVNLTNNYKNFLDY